MGKNDRVFRCLARDTRTNNVLVLFRKSGNKGFTRNPTSKGLARVKPSMFSNDEAKAAIRWGAKNGLAVFATKSKYPFLVLDSDTAWGNPELSRRLNTLGRRRQRYLWVGEYKRTSRRQWELRQAYLNGTGNLAAQCCTRYVGKHSWSACGKNSQSNHATGDAADASYLHSGRSGSYTNLGNDLKCRSIMKDIGLCLPVPGEAWHAQIGSTWRA